MYQCPQCHKYYMEWDGRAKVLMCYGLDCNHVIHIPKEFYDGIPTEVQIKAAIDAESVEFPQIEHPVENPWMDDARGLAAQCWCDPTTEHLVMDPVLAEVVARSIAHWMDTAAQCQRNSDFYRGLVVECGMHIGQAAYTQDDGGIVPDVLCAKVPELVKDAVAFIKTTTGCDDVGEVS